MNKEKQQNDLSLSRLRREYFGKSISSTNRGLWEYMEYLDLEVADLKNKKILNIGSSSD